MDAVKTVADSDYGDEYPYSDTPGSRSTEERL
jgi:hypothetical protein